MGRECMWVIKVVSSTAGTFSENGIVVEGFEA